MMLRKGIILINNSSVAGAPGANHILSDKNSSKLETKQLFKSYFSEHISFLVQLNII